MKRSGLIVVGVFLALCACSSLAPASFDQSLAEAYSVHTAVVEATTTALNAGHISADEARQVQLQAVSSRQVLDAAHQAEMIGNTSAARGDLSLALQTLTALQSYLNGRSTPLPPHPGPPR